MWPQGWGLPFLPPTTSWHPCCKLGCSNADGGRIFKVNAGESEETGMLVGLVECSTEEMRQICGVGRDRGTTTPH